MDRDQKDPRMWLFTLVPFLLIIAGIFPMIEMITKPLERSEIDRASLSVAKVTYGFGNGASSDKIFVYGDISNSSTSDAGKACLRINLLNDKNTIIDSFIQGTDGLVVPARKTIRLRFVSETPVKPSEIKKAEIVVERSRARGRFD